MHEKCDINKVWIELNFSFYLKRHLCLFQVNQMFTNFPLDVAGNLDYKNLCYVITHGEDKEQEWNMKRPIDNFKQTILLLF